MRPAAISIARLVAFALAHLLSARAMPVMDISPLEKPLPANDPSKWIDLAIAACLVLLGGVFAGLTIALMGLDDLTLKVTATSGEGSDQKNAAKVLKLLDGRKHWVLVTLLLGNVITNETLPIVLDRSLGGGWPAVVSSTVLIVIFGEIIPQSLCVRYGLPIGATFAPVVWILMWVLGIVAWPTGKLLDWLLGEDHGTVYKKAGLKTLVTLHKTLGTSPGDRLNHDEVTILTAVLDLKEKSVGSIMTPMGDVFTMSSDTVLDEEAMDNILSAGYSRIPIHTPDNRRNFIGMLLVKILITYDPEDSQKVSDFALATLPETRPETSCLDIINFFQEGKSHMVLVSDFPGENHGALGVVTLEDVIEEIIGEEIIDESDVYVDVHKAIRRLAPAPKARVPKGQVVTEQTNGLSPEERDLIDISESGENETKPASKSTAAAQAPSDRRASKSSLRRSSSTAAANAAAQGGQSTGSDPRAHLRHLGPSNLASRPKTTRYNTVKIKPGAGSQDNAPTKSGSVPAPIHYEEDTAIAGGVGAGLVNSAGFEARDGAHAVQSGYGSFTQSPTSPIRNNSKSARPGQSNSNSVSPANNNRSENISTSPAPVKRTQSHSTLGSLSSADGNTTTNNARSRTAVRSGSITENIIHAGGVRKVILEMTSSSSDVENDDNANGKGKGDQVDGPASSSKQQQQNGAGEGSSKNKKRRKKRGGKTKDSNAGEDTPLLGERRS